MKILMIVLGSLAGAYTVAQFLHLLAVFGGRSTIAGIGIVALGLAATIACFKKAFKRERRQRRHQ